MKTPPMVDTTGPVEALLFSSMWTLPAVIAPAVRLVEPMVRDPGGVEPPRAPVRYTVPAATSCSAGEGLAISVPAKLMWPDEESRATDEPVNVAEGTLEVCVPG